MATSPTSGPGGGGVTAPATIGPAAAGVTPLDVRAASGAAPVITFGNNVWDTDPTDPAGTVYAEDDGSLTISSHGFQRLLLRSTSGAIVFRGINAAPADAKIGPSDFALWFDDTHGAAKLMVKGQDAAGSFVTAAIALS